MRQAPGTCTASITPGREGDESPTGDNALACRPLTAPSCQHSPDGASAHADGKRRYLRANNRMESDFGLSTDINVLKTMLGAKKRKMSGGC